ncbi:26441_t:CDS:2, partial [Racocetra persica]
EIGGDYCRDCVSSVSSYSPLSPNGPIELRTKRDKYKTLELLKDKFPNGYLGYKMEFRILEFIPVNKRGERKFLHIHVVVKIGGAELLEVRIPSLKIEKENTKLKRSDRKSWMKLIKDNLDDIMAEIKERLNIFGISLRRIIVFLVKKVSRKKTSKKRIIELFMPIDTEAKKFITLATKNQSKRYHPECLEREKYYCFHIHPKILKVDIHPEYKITVFLNDGREITKSFELFKKLGCQEKELEQFEIVNDHEYIYFPKVEQRIFVANFSGD